MTHVIKVTAAIALAVLALSCGSKSSNKSGGETPQTGPAKPTPVAESADSTGFLMFSPPPGTYEGEQEIVIRPRAIETNRYFTFEVLNAKTEACTSNGPQAVCVTLTRDKTIEYVVRELKNSVSTEMHQIPGSAKYVINPKPTPTPFFSTIPAPKITIADKSYGVFTMSCSGSTMLLSLTNVETIGDRRVAWFRLDIPAAWKLTKAIQMKNGASMSNVVGNGDAVPEIASYAPWKATSCNIDVLDRYNAKGELVFAGNLHCDFERGSSSGSATTSFTGLEKYSVDIGEFNCAASN